MRARSSCRRSGVDGAADLGLEGDAGGAMQHHDAISHLERLVDRVGDEQRGLVALAHEAQELGAQALGGHLVERREWLVAQDQHGIDRQGAGDGDALAHAAGEGVRIVVLVAGETELGKPAAGGRFRRLAIGAEDVEAEQHVVDGRAPGHQPIALEDDADLAAQRREIAERVDALDGDAARVRLGQAGDQVEDGGLAAAGLAEQGDDLAARHLEGDAVDGGELRPTRRAGGTSWSRPGR